MGLEVRVVRLEGGGYEVFQGELSSGQLCLGEMLETVLKLLNPEFPGPRYHMQKTWEKAE